MPVCHLLYKDLTQIRDSYGRVSGRSLRLLLGACVVPIPSTLGVQQARMLVLLLTVCVKGKLIGMTSDGSSSLTSGVDDGGGTSL